MWINPFSSAHSRTPPPPPTVLYEPTAAEKACRVVAAGVHNLVTYSTPNLAELVAMGRGIAKKDEEMFEDLHGMCECTNRKCSCGVCGH